jgi:hypothetical protein
MRVSYPSGETKWIVIIRDGRAVVVDINTGR